MRVIATWNAKGGVGKTSAVVNLAAAIATSRRRVLVVDLDPQRGGSSTSWITPAEADPEPIHDSHRLVTRRARLDQCVVESTVPNVDLVPSGADLSALDRTHGGRDGSLDRLTSWTEELRSGSWSIVLLDAGPSVRLASLVALASATELLVPMDAGAPMEALVAVQETARDLTSRTGRELRVDHVLLNQYDRRLRFHREARELLEDAYRAELVDPPIRRSVRVPEACEWRLSVLQHEPRSTVAEDYRAAAETILARGRRVRARKAVA